MKPYHYYLALITLLFASNTLVAQIKEMKKAEDYFNKYEYYLALENYKLAETLGAEFTVEDTKKLARCYYYTNKIDNAFQLFTELEASLTGHDIFLYASSAHNFGFYEGAIDWYKKAKKEGENPVQIDELIKSCNWAIDNQQYLPYRVNPSTIGTFGQSFGIAYYKNGVVYSSASDEKSSKKLDKQGNVFLNLFYSDVVDGDIQPGKKLFSKNLVFPYHVGAISFSPDFNTMYYTKSILSKGNNRVKIYSVKYDGYDWGSETELKINSNEFDCAHPAVSKDNKYLYFVSNKKGGFGGKDIYVAEIKGDNQFGPVENVGKEINTFGDEVFPVINNDNKLYFSSNGLYGFGGQDLFSAEFINGKWTNVKNLMKPFNSNYDDFGFVIDPNEPTRGFLSSNNISSREDVIFYTRPAIENNINTADVAPIIGLDMLNNQPEPEPEPEPIPVVVPIAVVAPVVVPVVEPVVAAPIVPIPVPVAKVVTLKTTIISSSNNMPIPEVIFTVKDVTTGEIVKTITTGSNGAINFQIPSKFTADDQEFEIEISKGNDFKPKKLIVNIAELAELENSGISLTPVFNDKVLDDISGMVIPYVADKITADGYKILDQLAVYLMSNPNIVIKLNGHTDARGNRFTNLDQSQLISEVAEKYLISKGVNGDQTIPRSYGERYLTNQCKRGKYCDEADHLKNRRIDVVVWNK